MKYISIDLESTGKSDWCQVLEFGAIIEDTARQEDLKDLPVFHRYLIHDRILGEAGALTMDPIITILKRIRDRAPQYQYVSPKKLGIEFKRFLVQQGYELKHDQIVINVAGKNFGTSDFPSLKRIEGFEKHIRIRQRILDPAILCMEDADETLPSLSKCLERCGLCSQVQHDALSDAEAVIKVLREAL